MYLLRSQVMAAYCFKQTGDVGSMHTVYSVCNVCMLYTEYAPLTVATKEDAIHRENGEYV